MNDACLDFAMAEDREANRQEILYLNVVQNKFISEDLHLHHHHLCTEWPVSFLLCTEDFKKYSLLIFLHLILKYNEILADLKHIKC